MVSQSLKDEISLDSATRHILEECRMVLPGIQALFGFQLIAVFNSSFTEKLSFPEQNLHLVSMFAMMAASALVMAPAAIHRQAEPLSVSQRFIRMASGLLLWSMLALAVGLCLECYLITKVIIQDKTIALASAGVLLVLFLILWVILPRWEKNIDGFHGVRSRGHPRKREALL